jgi:hypothetical protein
MAWAKNSRSPHFDDEPLDDQARAVQAERAAIGQAHEPLQDACDFLPDSQGEFGFDPENPIPVNGHGGVPYYLERLRDERGQTALYHRVETLSIRARSVDVYELYMCGQSQPWRRLHLHVSHPRRSLRAPRGFSLQSWTALSMEQRNLMALMPRGANHAVEGFPFRLPEVVYQRFLEATGEMERARAAEMSVRRLLSLEGGAQR